MPTATDIGLAIQRARQRKRMTQAELADVLDVAKSTVANWESGLHFPLRYAGAIEEALGITIPPQVPAA